MVTGPPFSLLSAEREFDIELDGLCAPHTSLASNIALRNRVGVLAVPGVSSSMPIAWKISAMFPS
jgi:hypothetical protein